MTVYVQLIMLWYIHFINFFIKIIVLKYVKYELVKILQARSCIIINSFIILNKYSFISDMYIEVMLLI